MAIYANPSYFEQDERGTIDQVLVAVRYVGPSRRYSNNSTATQGRWPTNQDFLTDLWYVAFVPESTPDGDPGEGIAWFERSPEFEVEYDPEHIAEVLVDRYDGEIEAGGPIGENDRVPDVEGKMRDALDLDDPTSKGGTAYREQLKDLAGVDDEAAAGDPLSEEERLVHDHDRTELKDMVKDARADAEEFNLRGKSMEDMAEFLVAKGEY